MPVCGRQRRPPSLISPFAMSRVRRACASSPLRPRPSLSLPARHPVRAMGALRDLMSSFCSFIRQRPPPPACTVVLVDNAVVPMCCYSVSSLCSDACTALEQRAAPTGVRNSLGGMPVRSATERRPVALPPQICCGRMRCAPSARARGGYRRAAGAVRHNLVRAAPRAAKSQEHRMAAKGVGLIGVQARPVRWFHYAKKI